MIIYGASGHAKVIIDSIKANGQSIAAIFDDNPDIKRLSGYEVLHDYSAGLFKGEKMIIAIGNNQIRKVLSEKVSVSNPPPTVIYHPSSVIASDVKMDNGTVVLHNATLQSNTSIGRFVIINTGATIDHDCVLGDFVHIAPNATLCGSVTVGEGTLVGAGSVVIPTISIGKWCVIGAGAVVIDNIPDNSLVVGNPGKIIKDVK